MQARQIPLLQLKNISKTYGNLIANQSIHLSIHEGSIHALLGENGAGKSTLVNIICGVMRPDSGEIYWQGEAITMHSPMVAHQLGIGIVFQHFALFSSLSILENIALGLFYKGSLSSLKKQIEPIIEHYKLQIHNLQRTINELSTAEKQWVEIIRCLMKHPKLLILDEPTSTLTSPEIEHLFETLTLLKQNGCAILFIGHKLNEIKTICDTATIIKKGHWVADCQLNEVSIDQLANMMVGKQVSTLNHHKDKIPHPVVLQFNYTDRIGFSVTKKPPHYTHKLQLKSGTMIGLAGMTGNGQEQLMNYLSGELTGSPNSVRYWDGEIAKDSTKISSQGEDIGHYPVDKRKKRGIFYVPTKRLEHSIVSQMNLKDNAFLGVSDRTMFCRHGLINEKKVDALSQKIIDQFDVQPAQKTALAGSLSGGNLQKYIVGRAILQQPKVLLISNPTWGLDVNARTFIHACLTTLRNKGVAILLASEDLDEIFNLCDEIVVMKKNQLSDVSSIKNAHIEKISMMMA